MHENYPRAKLVREVWGSLEFEIPRENVDLPTLFSTIEQQRNGLGIDHLRQVHKNLMETLTCFSLSLSLCELQELSITQFPRHH